MKIKKKILLIILPFLLFSSVFFLEDFCNNAEINNFNFTKGNQNYIVQIYNRDCGATTNISTQIKIIENGLFFDKEEIILIFSEEVPEIKTNFVDNKLVISYNAKYDEFIFEKKNKYNDIDILYMKEKKEIK